MGQKIPYTKTRYYMHSCLNWLKSILSLLVLTHLSAYSMQENSLNQDSGKVLDLPSEIIKLFTSAIAEKEIVNRKQDYINFLERFKKEYRAENSESFIKQDPLAQTDLGKHIIK